MIVSQLEIEGFRGIRTSKLNFSKLTALVGPNNSGKTTVTEALALVLGRDRLVRPLTEHDFTGSDPQEQSRIKIVASITGFEPNDPTRHTDWFRWGRATVKWLDADTGDIKADSTKPTDKLTCQIAYGARFDRESLEAVAVRYFYDTNTDPFADGSVVEPVPHDLIRKIGFFLVPANRTWDRTISFGSELFRRVVSYVGGRPAAAVLAERERLRAPEHPLDEDANLAELVGSINNDVESLFGNNSRLKLRLTTTDSDGILDAVFPHFATGDSIPLPSRRHGSGLISLQTIVLLMRFGQLRVAAGDGFMMVIEEPELHVPPPLQRKLVRMMQSMTTQTIVTTHSSTVAAIPEPHEILLLSNSLGHLSGSPLAAATLTPNAPNPIRTLLLSSRHSTVAALMHPAILLVEGKTDESWIRLLTKSLELGSADLAGLGDSFSHEVGVIPSNTRFPDVQEFVCGLGKKCLCLVDGDDAGRTYTAALSRTVPAPAAVLRWPENWAIEDVIAWIVAADPDVLRQDELAASGVPDDPHRFLAALQTGLKSDEIVHGLIADAFSVHAPCQRRIGIVLQAAADIAMGRDPHAGHVLGAVAGNGITMVWTLNHAAPGI